MAWRFRPRTREQCLPEGEYDAELASIEQGTSKKSGNPMVTVTLTIEHEGRRRKVRDWIVHVRGRDWHKRKIAAIAAALGESESHAAGTFLLGEHSKRLIRVCITLEENDQWGWTERVYAYMATGLGMGPDVLPQRSAENVSSIPW